MTTHCPRCETRKTADNTYVKARRLADGSVRETMDTYCKDCAKKFSAESYARKKASAVPRVCVVCGIRPKRIWATEIEGKSHDTCRSCRTYLSALCDPLTAAEAHRAAVTELVALTRHIQAEREADEAWRADKPRPTRCRWHKKCLVHRTRVQQAVVFLARLRG